MEKRPFGRLGEISSLTLGGGGIGQVWGPTTRDEAVATVREAVESGINFLDVAPGYGDGEAESVIGEAFGGQLPEGVRVSTKYHLGNVPSYDVLPSFERSLGESLARLKLDRIDLFFLHVFIVPDDMIDRQEGIPRSLFIEAVAPAFERLVASGRIGAWGITGIGVPSAIVETINSDPTPTAVQAPANLLDSYAGINSLLVPIGPRDIIASAQSRDVAVMGIRAVAAGALTDSFDRDIPQDGPHMADYRRAGPFRALAKEIGESGASLAHRYSLSMDGVSTVILGVKNRTELRECITAEAKGPLDPELIAGIEAAVRPPI